MSTVTEKKEEEKKASAPVQKKEFKAFLKPDQVLWDGEYKVVRIIGLGAFGQVYLVKEREFGRECVAKVETTENDKEGEPILLWIEAKALFKITDTGVTPRVLYVKPWTDEDGVELRILVMDRLGQNLEQVFNANGRQFPLETVLGIAE